ncbi:uncharacterized protein LOC116768774 [Danaus plexippus]|uniref:uncharacterized protein LOC116768774 n=1 Tax=Danaus plexippus TaxID=13037 RepID=UPI002AAF1F59|nr:uncharacterized protein LOC116768774 [Danaus plexippus]
MTDRTIASRPSLEQVIAIIDFMENHPALGLGQLKGLEGRSQSKKLWFKLTRIVNTMNGPTRPMKSWVKYWADKKSTVRAKVISSGGDPNHLTSNIEKRIWDLFLSKDDGNKARSSVKLESQFMDGTEYDDEVEDNNDHDTSLSFEEPVDFEERQMVVLEKLVKVMSSQAEALNQASQAAVAHAQAMEKLAEASDIQARAIDRLANTFTTMSGVTHEVRDAIVDIDASLKRLYTAPT